MTLQIKYTRLSIDLPSNVVGKLTQWFYENVYDKLSTWLSNDDLNEHIIFTPTYSDVIPIEIAKNVVVKIRKDVCNEVHKQCMNLSVMFTLRSDYGFSLAVLYIPLRFEQDVAYRYGVLTAMSLLCKICRKLRRLNNIVKQVVQNDFIKVVALFENFAKSKTFIVLHDTMFNVVKDLENFERRTCSRLEELVKYVKQIESRGYTQGNVSEEELMDIPFKYRKPVKKMIDVLNRLRRNEDNYIEFVNFVRKYISTT